MEWTYEETATLLGFGIAARETFLRKELVDRIDALESGPGRTDHQDKERIQERIALLRESIAWHRKGIRATPASRRVRLRTEYSRRCRDDRTSLTYEEFDASWHRLNVDTAARRQWHDYDERLAS